MAINVSQAFHRTSANPIDDTIALTKAEMLTVNDNLMPSKYFTVCQDDGQFYLYDKSNTADPTTGKFRVFEGGGGDSIQVDTLPTASISELGNIYQYVGVSDANYTNGCFYECVSDGEATPTYSWEMKPVMPSLEASDMADIVTPLPTGGRVTGFTPIGTIIPMIAETAPLYYLKCDGATYNKSDYPELAAHLLSMTNHSMYEVSGDNTKFKVPDLSGEFLRGTGTNGHSGQGNGADVGVHQDATQIPWAAVKGDGTSVFFKANDGLGTNYQGHSFADSTMKSASGTVKHGNISSLNVTATTVQTDMFSTRPTNTSVLYCIATKDIYIDARNIYSTTEKVVGEWLDGKPVYQKTIQETLPNCTTQGTAENKNVALGFSLDNLVNVSGFIISSSSGDRYLTPFPFDNTAFCFACDDTSTSVRKNILNLRNANTAWNGATVYITIQYTKATT